MSPIAVRMTPGGVQPVIVDCPGCGMRNRVPAAANGRPLVRDRKQDLPWIADAGD